MCVCVRERESWTSNHILWTGPSISSQQITKSPDPTNPSTHHSMHLFASPNPDCLLCTLMSKTARKPRMRINNHLYEKSPILKQQEEHVLKSMILMTWNEYKSTEQRAHMINRMRIERQKKNSLQKWSNHVKLKSRDTMWYHIITCRLEIIQSLPSNFLE